MSAAYLSLEKAETQMPNLPFFDSRQRFPIGAPRPRLAMDAAPRFRLAHDEIDSDLQAKMRGAEPNTALRLFLEEHCRLSAEDLETAEQLIAAAIGENDRARDDQAEEEERVRELKELKAKAAKAEDAIRRGRARDRRTASDGAMTRSSAVEMFPSLAKINQCS